MNFNKKLKIVWIVLTALMIISLIIAPFLLTLNGVF